MAYNKFDTPGKGVLIDLSKCVGCGSCSLACKMWNDLKFDDKFPDQGPDAKLSDKNWTAVRFHAVEKDGQPVFRFVKNQCLHCQQPACESACFSRAFQRTESGATIYYPHLCVGCRYCMLACPFNVPKFQWDQTFPLVTKCQMCFGRIEKGEAPACVGVCPTNVMTFGDRDELLALARKTIESDDKYVKHIYGEHEAGGTNWLYISDVPFEQLGFRTDVTTRPIPEYSHEFLKYTPPVIVAWGGLLSGMYIYTKRRNKIAKEEKKDMSV
ncbi:4Fe-4S dicluster domain-containing protein [Desulfofalx alkaliphila]|uniref:4Fe-4S dicluster domain-containing protein n=1 Tax=Desulfofalx alkaliphila TaxID=105483 RepID=UPI0004E17198|nr:4Fe-4S dicluster domain-containing protein [Desulfofalx alkaliphila]